MSNYQQHLTSFPQLIAQAKRTMDVDLFDLLSFEETPGYADYVDWVKAWKMHYHGIVKQIRELKAFRADKANPVDKRMGANNARQGLRPDAHAMLRLRAAGKAHSRLAWQARKAA